MRYAVLNFSQEKAVENKLDANDLFLLDYIYEACASPRMKKIHDDSEQTYVWLQHKKLLEDLPILGFGEDMLKKRLRTLSDKGLISSIVKSDETRGRRTYYTITARCEDMRYTNQVENITLSQEPKDDQVEKIHLGEARPSGINSPSDNTLIRDNTSTNVEVAKPAVTPKQNSKRKPLIVSDTVREDDSISQPKKKNKYQNCMDITDEIFQDIELRKILSVYLPVRLAMKDKPIFAEGWRRLLNTLKDMTSDNAERVKIVEQSIDNGWGKFVRLKKYGNYNSRKKFAEGSKGLVNIKANTEEDLDDVF